MAIRNRTIYPICAAHPRICLLQNYEVFTQTAIALSGFGLREQNMHLCQLKLALSDGFSSHAMSYTVEPLMIVVDNVIINEMLK